MKRATISLLLVVLLTSLASAAVTIEEQPLDLYNLKDKIEFGVKIIPAGDTSDLLTIFLSCENTEIEVHKEYIITDVEINKEIILPLIKEFIGEALGSCELKYSLGLEEDSLSKKFIISNRINLNLETNGEYKPGETFSINGIAIRENGKNVDGIIEAKIEGTEEIYITSTISEGKFTLEISVPSSFKAGSHKVSLNGYEKNKFAQITNIGTKEEFIIIEQIPTNLEIVLDENEILPGKLLKGQVSLRDQTGEKMSSKVYVAIKNSNEEIIEKIQTTTDIDFAYAINNSEAPGNWIVSVYSGDLLSKMSFNILEHKEVSINIINKTLIIENKGNVLYNETVEVKIGNKNVNVSINLDVLESERYSITAPNGEYTVSVGNFEKMVSLTGNAVKLEKLSDSDVIEKIKIYAWIFIALVLALVAFIFFKRGWKKTFFGRRTGKKSKAPLELKQIPELEAMANPKVKGELSLSITGTRQNAAMGCIFIKNYEDTKSGVGGVKETLGKIASEIEREKGIIYENRGNVFFILPPVKTRTFKNEVPMINLSEKIESILRNHNKKFKQKINFGIGLNYGTIVTKQEKDSFKFMSMGTLLTVTKKLANKSDGEPLFSNEFKERLPKEFKIENLSANGFSAYKVVEIKHKADHSKFIKNFVAKNYK